MNLRFFGLVAALVLSSCSAAQKVNEKTVATTVADLCKLLPPLDPAEEVICATAISADEVAQKFLLHEDAVGLVRVAGVLRLVASASASTVPSPAISSAAPAASISSAVPLSSSSPPASAPSALPAAAASAAPIASAPPSSSAKPLRSKK